MRSAFYSIVHLKNNYLRISARTPGAFYKNAAIWQLKTKLNYKKDSNKILNLFRVFPFSLSYNTLQINSSASFLTKYLARIIDFKKQFNQKEIFFTSRFR